MPCRWARCASPAHWSTKDGIMKQGYDAGRGAYVKPDLSKLSAQERRAVVRYCNGAVMADWRLWAVALGWCAVAVCMSAVAATVFRMGGMTTGMLAGGAVGLVFGGFVGRVVERL